MTTAIMPEGRQRYFNNDGTPCKGGFVYTYDAGTTNPRPTYSDEAGTIPNPNPVPLDANGEALIYWSGAYKVNVKQADGTQVTGYPVDNVKTDPAGLLATIAGLALGLGAALVGFVQASAGAIKRTLLDKLRDTFDAKDYGATGDGVTNDAATILAMLTALNNDFGKFELVFSRGSYLIGSNITIGNFVALKFKAGAKFIIPDGVTLTLNNPELLAGLQQVFQCVGSGKVVGLVKNAYVLPEWWGAIADGIHPNVGTDFSDRAAAAARNGPALQAAFTFAGYQYAINSQAATVQLTFGGYVSDRELSLPLSANLVGSGISSALYLYAAAGNCLSMVNTNNSLVSDVFLAPLPGPTWNYSTGYGLYAKGVSTPCIRNVWSSSFGAGTFYFESVIEGRIHGLVSDNANGPAFVIRGVGQATILSNCLTAGTQNGACFDISGYDWHLIGCTAKDGAAGTNGFYLNSCEDINLTNCAAYSINKEGVVLTASALSCTLVDMTVNDASMLSTGTYAAMSISGTRNKLIGPRVTSNAPKYSYGILMGGAATDCTVSGENITPGTLGGTGIQDAQPIGANTNHVRKASTTDATATNLWSKWLNNSTACVIKATIMAKQRGAAGESATWEIVARAATGNGAPTLSAPVTVFSNKSNVASVLTANLVLTDTTNNAGVVSLQVTGIGGAVPAVDWEAIVTSIAVTG